MGELGAFLKIERHNADYRPPAERVQDFREFLVERPPAELQAQGRACMECGVPFCHNGCPLGNLIPDWNDLVYQDNWADAIRQLHATNNFPEFTGRLCPAPCEAACVLEIHEGDAVTIKQIENAIVNRAWEEGWIGPQPPTDETGRSVAVVGSGPAGMAAAQQLRRAGHAVVLYERDEAAGGLVRFGVPDFKIEKWVVERRVQQLRDEGVDVRCGVDVGRDVGVDDLRAQHDAVVLATGSRVPRDLPAPGRELTGIHPAMEYLYVRNRWVAAQAGPVPSAPAPEPRAISAAGKSVVVIGGGDTGADCVGNALREGATQVIQLELLPQPPSHRPDDRTPVAAVAAEDAPELRPGGGPGDRQVGRGLLRGHHPLPRRRAGRVRALEVADAEPSRRSRRCPARSASCPADLVLLAMGFLHPEPGCSTARAWTATAAATSPRARTPPRRTASSPRATAAAASPDRVGDQRGRQAARMCDRYLRELDARTQPDVVLSGNVHDADFGPEGPPRHVSGAVPASGTPAG
jgi:glutamate synthase (NADPH/NADH) small chain